MALRRSSSHDGHGGDLTLVGLARGSADEPAESPPLWAARALADGEESPQELEFTESSSSGEESEAPTGAPPSELRFTRKELAGALRPILDDALRPLYMKVDQLLASWGEVDEELGAVRVKLNDLVDEKRASPRQLTEGRVCAAVANGQLGLQKMDQLAKKIAELQTDQQQQSRKRTKVEADIESLYKGLGEVQGTLTILSSLIRTLSADLNYALELDADASQSAGGPSPRGGSSDAAGRA